MVPALLFGLQAGRLLTLLPLVWCLKFLGHSCFPDISLCCYCLAYGKKAILIFRHLPPLIPWGCWIRERTFWFRRWHSRAEVNSNYLSITTLRHEDIKRRKSKICMKIPPLHVHCRFTTNGCWLKLVKFKLHFCTRIFGFCFKCSCHVYTCF